MTRSKIRDRIRRLDRRFNITTFISIISTLLLFKAMVDFSTLFVAIFVILLMVESVYMALLAYKIDELEERLDNLDWKF